jgi:hypothetical protein
MAPRRRGRHRGGEQATIRAAIDRLLACTPLRSSSGKLTTRALITETGLRHDVVYEHPDLVDEYEARLKTQDSTPVAFQQLTDQNDSAVDQAPRRRSSWGRTSTAMR